MGSPYIETEHLLLGLLREDKALTRRFLSPRAVENICLEIQRTALIREKGSTSVDLPLSNEAKRARLCEKPSVQKPGRSTEK